MSEAWDDFDREKLKIMILGFAARMTENVDYFDSPTALMIYVITTSFSNNREDVKQGVPEPRPMYDAKDVYDFYLRHGQDEKYKELLFTDKARTFYQDFEEDYAKGLNQGFAMPDDKFMPENFWNIYNEALEAIANKTLSAPKM